MYTPMYTRREFIYYERLNAGFVFIIVEITIKKGEKKKRKEKKIAQSTIHRYRYGSIVIRSDCGVAVSRS